MRYFYLYGLVASLTVFASGERKTGTIEEHISAQQKALADLLAETGDLDDLMTPDGQWRFFTAEESQEHISKCNAQQKQFAKKFPHIVRGLFPPAFSSVLEEEERLKGVIELMHSDDTHHYVTIDEERRNKYDVAREAYEREGPRAREYTFILKRLAKEGYAPYQEIYGRQLLEGTYRESNSTLEQADMCGVVRHPAEGVRYLLLAAKSGEPSAQELLETYTSRFQVAQCLEKMEEYTDQRLDALLQEPTISAFITAFTEKWEAETSKNRQEVSSPREGSPATAPRYEWKDSDGEEEEDGSSAPPTLWVEGVTDHLKQLAGEYGKILEEREEDPIFTPDGKFIVRSPEEYGAWKERQQKRSAQLQALSGQLKDCLPPVITDALAKGENIWERGPEEASADSPSVGEKARSASRAAQEEEAPQGGEDPEQYRLSLPEYGIESATVSLKMPAEAPQPREFEVRLPRKYAALAQKNATSAPLLNMLQEGFITWYKNEKNAEKVAITSEKEWSIHLAKSFNDYAAGLPGEVQAYLQGLQEKKGHLKQKPKLLTYKQKRKGRGGR